MHKLRVVLLLTTVALLVLGCSKEPSGANAATQPSAVRIAAAASLKPVLPDLIAAFSKAHPELAAMPTYGASGNFHSQIVNGAPFDVFLSADMNYPQKLVEAGLSDGQAQEYAAGQLVIWTLKSSRLDPSTLEVSKDDRVKKISIANPLHAPYGKAAEAALRAAKLYDTVQFKLVLGESVEQAAAFARTGAAEIGLLPKSQALSPAMSEVGVYADVPIGLYEPIRHGAIVLKSAKDAAAAKAFVEFLTGPESQAILTKVGLGKR